MHVLCFPMEGLVEKENVRGLSFASQAASERITYRAARLIGFAARAVR